MEEQDTDPNEHSLAYWSTADYDPTAPKGQRLKNVEPLMTAWSPEREAFELGKQKREAEMSGATPQQDGFPGCCFMLTVMTSLAYIAWRLFA